MYAGNVEHVAPVLRSIRRQLEAKEQDPTYTEVEQAAVKAYQERLREEKTNTVLGSYGVTLEEFFAGGPVKVRRYDLFAVAGRNGQGYPGSPDGLSLLIAGYDMDGGAHILSVDHPGVARNHDIQGFWAIGSGAFGALGSLFFHSYNKKTLPETAVYHVAAAKFMAEESSSDVGKTTSLLIIEWEPIGIVLNNEGKVVPKELIAIETVKQIWQDEGRPKLPDNLYQRMKTLMGGQDATRRTFLGFKQKQ